MNGNYPFVTIVNLPCSIDRVLSTEYNSSTSTMVYVAGIFQIAA
jgi:hypothetical protein